MEMKTFKKRPQFFPPTFEQINSIDNSLFMWNELVFEGNQTFKTIQDVLIENKRIHDLLVSVGYVFEYAQIGDVLCEGYPELSFRSKDLGNRQYARISWRNEQQIYPEVTIGQLVNLDEPHKGKEYVHIQIANLYGDSLNENSLLTYKTLVFSMSLIKPNRNLDSY